MFDGLLTFIADLFNHNPTFATFLVALLPIFELRGAIPFGMSQAIWGANTLSPVSSFLISFLGSSLVIPILALTFPPILRLLKDTKLFKKIANSFENNLKTKSNKIDNSSTFKKMLGIFLFVMVPLPLTGVYTGTCLAIILDLNFYQTLICVTLGNLVAGIIITLISTVFSAYTTYILLGFVLIVVVYLIVTLLKHFLKKPAV